MKRVLVRIYQYFRKMKRLCRWGLTVPRQRRKILINRSMNQIEDGKVMVLIPHSDDEWIGTSQLICSSREVLLCNMNMDGADSPELHYKRYLEMERNAKKFSKKLIQIDDIEQLTNTIKQYEPQYVLAPFFLDWHQEHREVLHTLCKAIENLSDEKEKLKVGMYQVSVPIPSDAVTHSFKMSFLTWFKKWKLFLSAYPSQKEIAYQRFALQEVINGKYSNAWAGEIYSIWNASEWCKVYNDLDFDETNIKQIKSKLNDIAEIREYVSALWAITVQGELK